MTFKTEVIGCYWQQETGEWLVKLKQTQADGSTRLFEDRCHLLLHGTGILNNFKWPKIEGMEKFKGKVSDAAIRAAFFDVIRLFILHDGRRTTKPNSGRTTEWQSSEVVPVLFRRECDMSLTCAKCFSSSVRGCLKWNRNPERMAGTRPHQPLDIDRQNSRVAEK